MPVLPVILLSGCFSSNSINSSLIFFNNCWNNFNVFLLWTILAAKLNILKSLKVKNRLQNTHLSVSVIWRSPWSSLIFSCFCTLVSVVFWFRSFVFVCISPLGLIVVFWSRSNFVSCSSSSLSASALVQSPSLTCCSSTISSGVPTSVCRHQQQQLCVGCSSCSPECSQQ